MATVTEWLSPDSFFGLVTLPPTLTLDDLYPFINRAAIQRLRPLLGATIWDTFTTWLAANSPSDMVTNPPAPDSDPFHLGLYALVEPFLVYGAWANYVLEGSITATATGLVEKQRADSITITDAHRAELRRYYKEQMEGQGAEITAYIHANQAATSSTCCIAPGQSSGLRFGKSQGRTQSQFGPGVSVNGPRVTYNQSGILPDTSNNH